MIQKTILIVINNGFISRSLLRSDFFSIIKKNFKQVVLIVPKSNIQYFRNKYGKDNVEIDSIKDVKMGPWQKRFFRLLKYSVHSKTSKVKMMRNIYAQDGRLKSMRQFIMFMPVSISYYLSKFKIWRIVLRKIYHLFGVDTECLNLLEKYKVDIVYTRYTSVSVYDFNLKLISAAKKKNILTIGNIFSWDNLYSKVFVHDHTDFLVVPNEIMKADAIRLGDFREDKIFVVGMPHFDFYFNKIYKEEKNKFFEKIGADPNKKMILFAGSTGFIRLNYEYFITLFDTLTRNEFRDVQFYLRPHPKTDFNKYIERFKNNKNLIFEKKEESQLGNSFEFSEDENRLMYNLLTYSDLLICVYSTILIDAAILDVPALSLNYSGGLKDGYYHSVKINTEIEHIKQVLSRNALPLANSDDELRDLLKKFLHNKNTNKPERDAMFQEQISKYQGTSAKRLAEVVMKLTVDNKK